MCVQSSDPVRPRSIWCSTRVAFSVLSPLSGRIPCGNRGSGAAQILWSSLWPSSDWYRFRFRCCLVEFLSGSTSQGFDV
ncbi:hypothetical protein EJB05_33441, partial [Eragrostis curvula]